MPCLPFLWCKSFPICPTNDTAGVSGWKFNGNRYTIDILQLIYANVPYQVALASYDLLPRNCFRNLIKKIQYSSLTLTSSLWLIFIYLFIHLYIPYQIFRVYSRQQTKLERSVLPLHESEGLQIKGEKEDTCWTLMSSKYAPHFSRVAKICNMASLEWIMQVSKYFAYLSSINKTSLLWLYWWQISDTHQQIHINIDWKNYAVYAAGALVEASISNHIVKETS